MIRPSLHVILRFGIALLGRRAGRSLVDDKRAVPALVDFVLFVIDDVTVDVIETRLPGLVFLE